MEEPNTNTPSASVDMEMLTLDQVAEILKVSVTTIRRYMHRENNPLPVVFISKQEIRVNKANLHEWLKQLPDPRGDVA